MRVVCRAGLWSPRTAARAARTGRLEKPPPSGSVPNCSLKTPSAVADCGRVGRFVGGASLKRRASASEKIVRALRREFARRLPRPRLRPSQPAGTEASGAHVSRGARRHSGLHAPGGLSEKRFNPRRPRLAAPRGARPNRLLKKILRPCLMKKRAASSSVKTFTRAARRAGKF